MLSPNRSTPQPRPARGGFFIQYDRLTAGDWSLDHDPNVLFYAPMYCDITDLTSGKTTAWLAGWGVTLDNGVEFVLARALDNDLTKSGMRTVSVWITACPWDNGKEGNGHEERLSLTPTGLKTMLAAFGGRDDLAARNAAGELAARNVRMAARAAQLMHGGTPPRQECIGSVPVSSGPLLVADLALVLGPIAIDRPYGEIAEAVIAGGGACLTHASAGDLAVAFRTSPGDGTYAVYALKQGEVVHRGGDRSRRHVCQGRGGG